MKLLIVVACLLAVAAAQFIATPFAHTVAHTAVAAPAIVAPYAYGTHLYRYRRSPIYPYSYSGVAAVHAPGVVHSAYSYPYAAHAAVLYRKRRDIVAPLAYTHGYPGYAHSPAVVHSAYSYPYAAHSAFLYRKRRDVVAPVAYSGFAHHGYAGYPYAYSPYAHYY